MNFWPLWLKSFLEGRSFRVTVDMHMEKKFTINARVPQVCILSLTFFFIYIINLIETSNHCLQFCTIENSNFIFLLRYPHTSPLKYQQITINTELSNVMQWGEIILLKLIAFFFQREQALNLFCFKTPMIIKWETTCYCRDCKEYPNKILSTF